MNIQQDKFFQLLSNYPYLEYLWDKEDATYDATNAANFIRLSSNGETIILKCLLSIWLGPASDHKISFIELATLDPHNRQPLLDWLSNPIFP